MGQIGTLFVPLDRSQPTGHSLAAVVGLLNTLVDQEGWEVVEEAIRTVRRVRGTEAATAATTTTTETIAR